MPRLLLATVIVVFCNACVPAASEFCDVEADCPDGRVCTRNGDCARPESVIEVRINWTVRGAQVAPRMADACGIIEDLAAVFVDRTGEIRISYRPIRCDLGTIYFDRMSPIFDRVELVAFGPGDAILDRRIAPLGAGENTVDVDLQP